MDVVTSLKKLGCPHVTDVVYETFAEFRASKKELEEAQKEGVSIIDGYVPVFATRGGVVKFKHRFINSELKIKADQIILAVGQRPNVSAFGIELEKNEVNVPFHHLDDKIFVAGDIAHGDKTVVFAVKHGKEVALEINTFLGGK